MGKKSREKRERRGVSTPLGQTQREPAWTPFVEADTLTGPTPEEFSAAIGMPVEEVKRFLDDHFKHAKVYTNNLYTVTVQPLPEGMMLPESRWPETVWVSIRCNNRGTAHDWRHFQRIKNELVGPDCEGIELYPAESRLVDTANQYHMFVFKDPDCRFPIGFFNRYVLDHDPKVEQATNTKQRKF